MLNIQNKKLQQCNHFNSFNVQAFSGAQMFHQIHFQFVIIIEKLYQKKKKTFQINFQKICLEISRKIHEKYA
jgi:hypothetical protein